MKLECNETSLHVTYIYIVNHDSVRLTHGEFHLNTSKQNFLGTLPMAQQVGTCRDGEYSNEFPQIQHGLFTMSLWR